MAPFLPHRPGDLAGIRGQAEQRLLPSKARPQCRCGRTWSRFRRRCFLFRPTRPPAITGLERGILVKQSEYYIEEKYKNIS